MRSHFMHRSTNTNETEKIRQHQGPWTWPLDLNYNKLIHDDQVSGVWTSLTVLILVLQYRLQPYINSLPSNTSKMTKTHLIKFQISVVPLWLLGKPGRLLWNQWKPAEAVSRGQEPSDVNRDQGRQRDEEGGGRAGRNQQLHTPDLLTGY